MFKYISLDRNKVFCALKKFRNGLDHFIINGAIVTIKAPDDTVGASLSFCINHFASGLYGSRFNRNRISLHNVTR